jgi:DNA invertase Pin-like site-specific DNA recombinase
VVKAYSYIRFSSPEQAKGDSLRRQLDGARAWCASRGLTLDESLRDLGVSAYRGSHRATGALRSFLDLVERGQVARGSYLVVESLDRLSREAVLDAAARLLDLVRAGVIVVTLADGQEYSEERLRADWTPLVVSITIMARAHEESRLKGERVAAAWSRKRLAARQEGRPTTKRCPSWLLLIDGRFHVDPERAAVVRDIFRMAVEGYGQRAIVVALNQASTPTFRGGKGWQTSTVRRILTSRTVLGEYQPHTGSHRAGTRTAEGEPIRAYYPAVVEDRTFWRAQRAIEGRRTDDQSRGQGGRRGHGVAHLLLGLGRCARCSGPMHVINKGSTSKGGLYFVCSTSMRRAGCENDERWRVAEIEQRLLRGLTHLDTDAVLSGMRSDDSDVVGLLQVRLNEVERRRDRLLDLVETGDEAAAARFTAVATEVRRTRDELAAAEAQASKASADPGLQVRLTGAVDLFRAMENADGESRRAIRVRLSEELRTLVHEVSFDPELGALAVLTPQPGVPPERVPWIVGSESALRWQIWLEGDPHGLEGLVDEDLDVSSPPTIIRR